MTNTLGPYEINERLGSGGMGTVYRARDTRSELLVALKVLHDHRSGDGDDVRRFEREGGVATKLRHPNIARVIEAGSEGDTHYLAMELVDGETLLDRLSHGPRLAIDEVRTIAIAIAAALEEAHHQRIVHRDIKPGNVLLGNDGAIKVSDFGIARALDATTLTRTGTFLGSLPYASPEAINGDVDARSDLYSLGVLLYQALLGSVPFQADTPAAIMRMHETARPPNIDRLHAIDDQLAAIIERLLEKDPDDRFQSATHLLRVLRDPQTKIVERRKTKRGSRPGCYVLVGIGASPLVAAIIGLAIWFGLRDTGGANVAAGPPSASEVAATRSSPSTTSTRSASAISATGTANAAATAAIQFIFAAATGDANVRKTASSTPTISRTATPTVAPQPKPPALGVPSPAFGAEVAPSGSLAVTIPYTALPADSLVGYMLYFKGPFGIVGYSGSAAAAGDGAVSVTYSNPDTLTKSFCGYRITLAGRVDPRAEDGCKP